MLYKLGIAIMLAVVFILVFCIIKTLLFLLQNHQIFDIYNIGLQNKNLLATMINCIQVHFIFLCAEM